MGRLWKLDAICIERADLEERLPLMFGLLLVTAPVRGCDAVRSNRYESPPTQRRLRKGIVWLDLYLTISMCLQLGTNSSLCNACG